MSSSTSKQMSWSRWHNRLHKSLISKADLLPKNSSLILSISGGQDSMALLQLIYDLQKIYHWKLYIWHGDHGWHKQSTQFKEELQKWCIDRNLQFSYDQSTKQQLNSEESARNWRYKNLVKYAKILTAQNQTFPCNHVLTGHTSTDRAETLIFNLSRGCHLKGLGSLRYSRKLEGKVNLVRPFLIFNREDTKAICREMNLPVWIDPSNENVKLSRNKIRQDILPILEQLHPGSSRRIASLAERLSHLSDNEKVLANLAIESMKSPEGLSRKKFIELPMHARTTILAQWLKNSGLKKFSASQLEEISKSSSSKMPPGKRDLPNGWLIQWNKESILLSHQKING